ncbi:H-type lectin domain-containing protein [Phanerochaete sordida]|uniref:H-type lectin domain-containing protein n=1 Tax=Phanerochaete sordida TaxID=48140 RepID=A0A9P3LDB0_9APHY|nr:H-type lectin domain-containing protein [Phanerochaete sordida]
MYGVNRPRDDPSRDTQHSSYTRDVSFNTNASVNAPHNSPLAVEPTLPFDNGEFRTMDVRSWEDPRPVTVGEARFKTPSCYTRAVLLGLSELDLDILRIRAEVRTIADDRAILNLTTWADTVHYLSGCSWLSLPLNDPDIQWGRYSTTEDRPPSPLQQKTSRRITFGRPYAAPPRVAVWLDSADSGPEKNVRVAAFADDVTREGFTVHLDAWGDSHLYSAGATWLAHSDGRQDMRSGAFEIEDVRPASAPCHQNRGRVSWGPPAMARPPRVFAALRMLDFGHGRHTRIRMKTEEITETGMTWSFESWADTVFYQAGAVFIAFEGSEW